MQVTTVGLDLAKNIFHVHGVSETGEVAFNRPLRRAQVLAFFERLSPCLIGIESCASSHYWGRELTKLGQGRPRSPLVTATRRRGPGRTRGSGPGPGPARTDLPRGRRPAA